jgi:hypothetical protein
MSPALFLCLFCLYSFLRSDMIRGHWRLFFFFFLSDDLMNSFLLPFSPFPPVLFQKHRDTGVLKISFIG